MTEISIHPVQAQIVLLLLSQSNQSFSQLNKGELTNDWFSYHLRQVIKKGWVEKSGKKYVLSSVGKKLALQVNPQEYELSQPQRVSVLLVIQDDDNYLIQQRLSEPFYGVWEFPTARIPFGVQAQQFAEELLKQETGIITKLQFCGVNQKVETKNKAFFDDKYYLVFKGLKEGGEMLLNFPGGKNFWLTKQELLAKEKTHFDLRNTLRIIEGKSEMTFINGEVSEY